jgi:hypothetical protein
MYDGEYVEAVAEIENSARIIKFEPEIGEAYWPMPPI